MPCHALIRDCKGKTAQLQLQCKRQKQIRDLSGYLMSPVVSRECNVVRKASRGICCPRCPRGRNKYSETNKMKKANPGNSKQVWVGQRRRSGDVVEGDGMLCKKSESIVTRHLRPWLMIDYKRLSSHEPSSKDDHALLAT